MTLLKQEDLPSYSDEDYQHWEGNWELIEGIPYAMSPSPVKNHQMLVGYIFSEITSTVDQCPDCEVLIDEDWKLNSQTILKPDVSVVCHDDNPTYITKTPDVIFEVISPATARRDEGLKFQLYQEQGVQYYILVYPNDLIAKVFQLRQGKLKKVAECDSESFDFEDISCPFTVSFAKIFKRFVK